jgi:hypothetical protein
VLFAAARLIYVLLSTSFPSEIYHAFNFVSKPELRRNLARFRVIISLTVLGFIFVSSQAHGVTITYTHDSLSRLTKEAEVRSRIRRGHGINGRHEKG